MRRRELLDHWLPAFNGLRRWCSALFGWIDFTAPAEPQTTERR